MNKTTDILEFCEAVLVREKEKEPKDPKNTPITRGEKIKIVVANDREMSTHAFFELDDEDVKYLYDKYQKKLQGELDNNISKMKEKYNKVTVK